jgi:plastocyanin
MVLQPNEARDLYFVADKAGAYPLTCADHDWDGMVGEITIE